VACGDNAYEIPTYGKLTGKMEIYIPINQNY
jgi:hypothetical protein